ncbi:hypothetical protein YC2023_073968 [Brassica napus]
MRPEELKQKLEEETARIIYQSGMTQAHLEATKRAKTKYFWFLLLCISVICCRTATTTTKRSILRDYTNLMLKESSIRLRDKFLKEHNITQSSSLLRKTRGYLVKLVILGED